MYMFYGSSLWLSWCVCLGIYFIVSSLWLSLCVYIYVYIFYNKQFMIITVLYVFAAFCTATNLGWLSQLFHVAFSQILLKEIFI